MSQDNRLIKAFKHPEWLLGVIMRHTPITRWMKDRQFIKWECFTGMRKFPDLEHPRTFNEKLQWLKLNDIHPEYERLVDKYEAKVVVSQLMGGGTLSLP